ncbi:hypothetical protein CkaCkLH20_03661 [Colletotrichum karsti]|uniref:Chromo domain-containing protein n=1 Tax=Colletotrichum karsti TaxID=1095194 RepID=A0A9P6LN18_9PEZI|nr:uncharacterized protein CkaCkLH20_03661 [Colletotrichum karsti]KAF9878761.1 hypothetical protein CkaCkLH20_03661 [Colletotrichum karsti]
MRRQRERTLPDEVTEAITSPTELHAALTPPAQNDPVTGDHTSTEIISEPSAAQVVPVARSTPSSITAHQVDPTDASRVQMLVRWDPSGDGTQAWEDERYLQVEHHDAWLAYIEAHDPRAILGPNQRHLWHILSITNHRVVRRGSARRKTIMFMISWEGSNEETEESEAFVRRNNPAALCQYWETLGGRANACR